MNFNLLKNMVLRALAARSSDLAQCPYTTIYHKIVLGIPLCGADLEYLYQAMRWEKKNKR